MSSPSATGSSHYYTSVQVLRGLAAFAVILFHVGEMLFLYSDRTGLFCSLEPIWQRGAAGVDLFFIISGFVMVQSTHNLFQQPAASKIFLGRRFVRIVPLYWLYTSLMLLLVLLPFTLKEQTFSAVYTLKSFLFIPAINPATGLDLPLLSIGWTLFYEMYFYLIFALLLNFPKKIFLPAVSIFFSLSVIAGLQIHTTQPLLKLMTSPLLLEFIFGCVLAVILNSRKESASGSQFGQLLPYFMLVCGAMLLLLFPPAQTSSSLRPLYQGIPALLLCCGLICLERRKQPVFPRFLLTMGNSSYSTYLSHLFVILMVSTLLKHKLIPGMLTNNLLAAATIVLCLVAGYCSYRYVEKTMAGLFVPS